MASKKPVKKTIYEWFMVVEGSGDFPLDMLRYDSAFPAESTDASAMEKHEKRRVVLCRRGVNELAGNPQRWKSFCWNLIHITTELYEAREVADGKRASIFQGAL